MLHLANELILIDHGVDYNSKPIQVAHTSGNRNYQTNMIMKGATKIGRGNGPVVEIDIVRAATGAKKIEIWAHDMDLNEPGIIYALTHFTPSSTATFCGTTKLKDFYFRQLKWLDASDEEIDEPEGATVVGKRLKYIPNQYDPNVT